MLTVLWVQALTDARANSLLMWASRYNLFVLWSADHQHPWDSQEPADGIAAVLEVGKAEMADDEVCAACTQAHQCRLHDPEQQQALLAWTRFNHIDYGYAGGGAA